MKIRSQEKDDKKFQKVREVNKDGKWNRGVVMREFEEEDRWQILKIPLSLGRVKDRIYWAKSNSGVYTVKTGYKLIKEMKKGQCQTRGAPEPSISRRIKSQS